MINFTTILELLTLLIMAGVVIYLIILVTRFVKAQERSANALDSIARKPRNTRDE